MNKRLMGKLCVLTLLVVATWQTHVLASGCTDNHCFLDGPFAMALCENGGEGMIDQESACDDYCIDAGFPGGSNDHYCNSSNTELHCECNGNR